MKNAGSCCPADAVLSKRNADLILTKKISLEIQVSNCVETVGHNSFWKKLAGLEGIVIFVI